MKTRIGFVLMATLIPLLSSCSTPRFPHYSRIPDGTALPIDGEWVNDGGLRVRISHGKLYTLNRSRGGTPLGSVLAKDIQRVREGRYACKTESHNAFVLDFGEGEIIVTGSTTLVLKAAPNQRTGFLNPTTTQFRKTSLDREDRYAAELDAILSGIKANTNLTSLVLMGASPEYKNSELALEALVAAVDLLKDGWETISEDEYRRNFTAPDGTLLPELLHEIKRKRGMAPTESISVEYFPGSGATLTKIRTGPIQQAVVELSFSTHGLDYSRKEYGSESIVYETVTRKGSTSDAAVTTEAFHIHGAIYRTSKVTGL